MKIENGELILDPGERTLRPGIFTKVEGDGNPHLVARRCPDCGDVSFPPFRYCLKCGSDKETIEKVLSRDGVLVSYTIARQVMPGFDPAGYILGKVRIKDDPTLTLVAQLTDVREEDVEVGMELSMVTRKIKTLMNGEQVVSYCFQPRDPGKLSPAKGGWSE